MVVVDATLTVLHFAFVLWLIKVVIYSLLCFLSDLKYEVSRRMRGEFLKSVHTQRFLSAEPQCSVSMCIKLPALPSLNFSFIQSELDHTGLKQTEAERKRSWFSPWMNGWLLGKHISNTDKRLEEANLEPLSRKSTMLVFSRTSLPFWRVSPLSSTWTFTVLQSAPQAKCPGWARCVSTTETAHHLCKVFYSDLMI